MVAENVCLWWLQMSVCGGCKCLFVVAANVCLWWLQMQQSDLYCDKMFKFIIRLGQVQHHCAQQLMCKLMTLQ
jgi:hypothetical protein